MVKAEGRRMTGGPGCDGITRCRRGGRGLGKYRVHGGRLWAPHLLATPAIVIGRRKKGTPRVIIISHFQVERETRQVQFYQGRKRIETLSSRDACSAGLNFGLRVCCASGSAASSMLWRVCWATLPILPCHALDSCEMDTATSKRIKTAHARSKALHSESEIAAAILASVRLVRAPGE